TSLTHAASNYAKSAGTGGGTDDQIQRLLGRQVAVFGGASGAARSAAAGRVAIARLGEFFSSIAEVGFAEAIERIGLQHLIGGDRFDVLDELLTLLTGDGGDLESQAARDAQCDVLDEYFGTAESWDDMAALSMTELGLEELLRDFLARYVYNRIPAIGERLARIMNPVAARRADERIIEMIEGYVEIHLPSSALNFDWAGAEGRDFANEAVADVYRALEAFGDGDL
ncbi:hypothetical protein, partial [Mycetocola sp.]|uniref:hypothetical protein n=1 Tax=Mycetocola sp. TaxID=1871042 RepID=UPI0039896110